MRIKHLIILATAGLIVSGCGGGGLLNPFSGSFPNEPWTQFSPSDSGTITFNISVLGVVSGTMVDTGAAMNYTVSGVIDAGGNLNATITPTSGPASTISGVMSINGSNQLVGTLADTG